MIETSVSHLAGPLEAQIYQILSEGIPLSVREIRDALPVWPDPFELQAAIALLKQQEAIAPALTPPSYRPDIDPSGGLRWTITNQDPRQQPTPIEQENTVPLSSDEQILFDQGQPAPHQAPHQAPQPADPLRQLALSISEALSTFLVQTK